MHQQLNGEEGMISIVFPNVKIMCLVCNTLEPLSIIPVLVVFLQVSHFVWF